MIDFYYTQIENSNYENNIWYEHDKMHFFKLAVDFQNFTYGNTTKICVISDNNPFSINGFFFPSAYKETYFITNMSSGSIELMSNICVDYDTALDGSISPFYYKIPWYYIPKNYLNYQPKHLIMMFNMHYLMQSNPNNSKPTNNYYDKYYEGINVSVEEIEHEYVKFMTSIFPMHKIILYDYLNL